MSAPRTSWRAPISWLLIALAWVEIAGLLFAGLFSTRQGLGESTPNRHHVAESPQAGQAASNDGYLGSSACESCHKAIYASFAKTRMGRSMTVATPDTLQSLHLPSSIYNPATDRHFDVYAQQGQLLVSEYQTGPQGQEVFRKTKPVQWIIGANTNGLGGIVQRGAYLFEAPVSYYVAPQKWGVSPGYEDRPIGFSRPILAGCIFCHSGRPEPADTDTGKFKPVPFRQLAIGCENCHGPGAAHVQSMRARTAAEADLHIVNPDRLSARLENDICMSCHESGDVRVPRPGKSYLDFRPGQPLDKTLAILTVPIKRSDVDTEDHLQQYLEMRLSKCYRATAGQLRCATCHDPHVEPTAAEAPAYFNAKCMNCHADHLCTLPAPERAKTTPANNCIGCHMPRRKTPQIAHSSLTNHRVMAQSGEPLPDEAFSMTTPDLPDLVHLDREPSGADPLPPVMLLEIYQELSNSRPEYKASFEIWLKKVAQTDPNHGVVQQALGEEALANGHAEDALGYLELAVKLKPQEPRIYTDLAQAEEQLGRLDEAIASAEHAQSLDPYDELAQKTLIECLIAARQYRQAIASMDHYLQVFPDDGFMRKMLTLAQQ